jgi:metal transporter CNNM
VTMWVVYPIAYPMAKLLDYFVPHDNCAMTNYTRNELAALIRLQYEARCTAEQQRQAQEAEQQQSPQQQSTKQQSTKQQGDEQLLSSPRGVTGATGSADNNNTTPSSVLQQQKIQPTFSLDLDEVMMAEGALALRSRQAADLVISHRKVFSISYDAALTEEMIIHIFASGYSRVPVYRGKNPKHICGILMTRQLILVHSTDNKKVSDLPLHSPRCIAPSMDLVALVNLFQTGGGAIGLNRRSAGHMAIVCSKPDMANEALQADGGDQPIPLEAGVMGIITMEDVLETLLQEQIYDEMDAAGRLMHSDSISVSTAAGSARNNNSRSPHFQHRSAVPKQPPPTSADNTSCYTAMV